MAKAYQVWTSDLWEDEIKHKGIPKEEVFLKADYIALQGLIKECMDFIDDANDPEEAALFAKCKKAIADNFPRTDPEGQPK